MEEAVISFFHGRICPSLTLHIKLMCTHTECDETPADCMEYSDISLFFSNIVIADRNSKLGNSEIPISESGQNFPEFLILTF